MTYVMIAVPVQYPAGEWLHRFLEQVDQFPVETVSRIVFSYGEPRQPLPQGDPTLVKLKQWKATTKHRVEVVREPKLQALSSAQIAAIYQDFQSMFRSDESHVLLLDADVVKMPSDLISKLANQDKDIIAPYVWMRNHVPPLFYDSHVFRYKGYRFYPIDPPNPKKTFELDSAGTCLLVKREVFKASPYDNPYPHMRFCRESKEKGFKVWADPNTVIEHLDITRLGIFHAPIEQMLGQKPDLTSFIDSKDNVIDPQQFVAKLVSFYVDS